MPGGVDNVDCIVFPLTGDGSGDNRNAAFTFFRQVVGGGAAAVHIAHFVDGVGVEKDTLRGGGFAGVDVGDDADISSAHQRRCRGGGDFGTIRAGCVRGIHGVFRCTRYRVVREPELCLVIRPMAAMPPSYTVTVVSGKR